MNHVSKTMHVKDEGTFATFSGGVLKVDFIALAAITQQQRMDAQSLTSLDRRIDILVLEISEMQSKLDTLSTPTPPSFWSRFKDWVLYGG